MDRREMHFLIVPPERCPCGNLAKLAQVTPKCPRCGHAVCGTCLREGRGVCVPCWEDASEAYVAELHANWAPKPSCR